MFEKSKGTKSGSPEPQQNSTYQANPAAAAAPSPTRQPAVIGSSITIKGDVSGDENLIIEGSVEGEIKIPSHEVTIGSSGSVNANVKASTVRIEGTVRGDIHGGEKVIIARQGNVRGNIVAPRVTLEDGAIFKGSIDMDPGDVNTTAAPLTTKEAPEKKPAAGDASGFALKSG